MTDITINGRSAPGFVSNFALSRRLHKQEEWVLNALTKADNSSTIMRPGAGISVPFNHPAIEKLLAKANIKGPIELHTVANGAKLLGHTSSAPLQQAVAGADALFFNSKLQPVFTLDELRGAMSMQRAPGMAAAADTKLAIRALKVSAPAVIGAALVTVGSLKLANQLGSKLDSADHVSARRTGALAGAAIVATGSGLMVGWMARGVETKTAITRLITRGAVGTAIGGAAVGAVAVLAMGTANDQKSPTAVAGVAK